MISKTEKGLLHVYAKAAGLSDPEYREILRAHTGFVTAADKRLKTPAFRHAMAALEVVLFQRVADGLAPNPADVPGNKITDAFFWRRSIPTSGIASGAQVHSIKQLWDLLQDYLQPGQATALYLSGIIQQAAGLQLPGLHDSGRLHWHRLQAKHASHAIDALKDRLKFAVRR